MDLSRRVAPGTVVVRSRWGRLGTLLALLLSVLALVFGVAQQQWHSLLQVMPLMLEVSLVAGLLWWFPHLEVGRDVLVVANPLRTIRLGWGQVAGAHSRLGLQVDDVRGRRHHAWAAPARAGGRGLPEGHVSVPDGGVVDLDAHAAARLLEERRLEHRGGGDEVLEVHWEVWRIVALVVLTVAVVLTL